MNSKQHPISEPTGSPGPLVRWLMPSIGSFCLLLILYLLVISGWRFLLDSDTGWHIRTGEMILRTGEIPRTDPFSHTLAGREWFAWEWLADVLMALAHQWRGLAGVVGGALIVLLLAYGVLQQVMIRRGSDPLLAGGLTLFAAICCIVHWLARPHLFSILLMVIWLAMVEDYRRRRSRWILATPLLVVLWANLHGAFAIIFALLVIYAVGELGEQLLARRFSMAGYRSIGLTYGVVGLLSALAALVTPFGAGLYRHIWRYLNDRELLASIQEFQSPDFHQLDGKLVEVLLFLGAVAVVLAWREGRLVEAGLFILWAHLTLQSERHVTLAAVTLTPIVAEQLTRVGTSLADRLATDQWRWRRIWRVIHRWYGGIRRIDQQVTGLAFYLGALILMVGLTASSEADKLLSPRFSPQKFPVAASDFIEKQALPGKGYAHDQFGGYLIYRLWPRYGVFVDGRSDFYRQGTVLEDMEKVSLVRPEWATKLDQYEIQWMLLRRDEPLVMISLLSGNWRKVYEDSVAQVLIRATP
jgi:hypothetical protein